VKKSHHPEIRELLKAWPGDGLTIPEIATRLNVRKDTITNCLAAMPDAYIDRWDGPVRGQWVAVWMVVEVPENCPRPS
jgi:hypothetical protein